MTASTVEVNVVGILDDAAAAIDDIVGQPACLDAATPSTDDELMSFGGHTVPCVGGDAGGGQARE